MMTTEISEYVSYEEDGNVGIWKIEDLPVAIEADDMETTEQHYVETASGSEMEGVIVTVGGVENMDTEVIDHVEEKWTDVAEQSGVDYSGSEAKAHGLAVG